MLNTEHWYWYKPSSDVKDFDAERLNMEIILLLHGYPPKFISHHIKNLFNNFNAMSVWTELDTDAYKKLHHQLLHKPTRRERENCNIYKITLAESCDEDNVVNKRSNYHLSYTSEWSR